MWARFTVLSDTPIAAAIAGCAIPLSRNSTIWMRWRCAAGLFHRSQVSSRRTSALLHLTIRSPESDGPSESHLKRGIQPVQAVSCIIRIEPIHAVMELVLHASCHPSSIGDLLHDEFALLQSDFTREVFCYSGNLPTIDLTIL